MTPATKNEYIHDWNLAAWPSVSHSLSSRIAIRLESAQSSTFLRLPRLRMERCFRDERDSRARIVVDRLADGDADREDDDGGEGDEEPAGPAAHEPKSDAPRW